MGIIFGRMERDGLKLDFLFFLERKHPNLLLCYLLVFLPFLLHCLLLLARANFFLLLFLLFLFRFALTSFDNIVPSFARSCSRLAVGLACA